MPAGHSRHRKPWHTDPVPGPGALGEDGPCFLRLHASLPELLPAMEGPEEQPPHEVRGWVGSGDGCRVPGAPGVTPPSVPRGTSLVFPLCC